ncbi:MAG: AmpG family muropeptide MFS transporter [Rhodospirillaceae bacterium]|nr:AmpG family muropeptide MFS transporter [Rhodospirillaceae bacterium]
MLICIFQGFSSGMPLYVLVQLIPAWLRTEGIDLATIGLFTIVTLPYTWKFLWAPFIDRFSLPFLGRRRGWALTSQCLLLICITQFGAFDPSQNLVAVIWLVFLTSLFSATQDIVLDAYRREMLTDDELGTGNSIFINAYRVSSLIPGSIGFVLADFLPWTTVFWVVGMFMSIGIITTLLIPEASDDEIAPRTIKEAVVNPFKEFFSRDGIKSALLILSFMFFYKLGDNMAVALQTPFFIDIGFTLTEIGTTAKFVILGSTIIGTLLGGLLMLRLSINRALWLFGFVQIISIFGYAALAKIGNNIYALSAAASLEYIGVGLGIVALTAFMAKQTSRRFTATQFALLTSLMAVPRTFANATTGFIVQAIGYFNFFLLCALVAVPGMLLLIVVAPWSETEDQT